jgi:hypothetical protein
MEIEMKKKRIRVQLVILAETNALIEELCLSENRTRSAVVDEAIKAYAKRKESNDT